MSEQTRAAPGLASPREILVRLNSLRLGELTRVQRELEQAGEALLALGEDDLAARLAQARLFLSSGNMREFRRGVAHVTARLGHLE